jgi:hypothetical protein
MITGATPCNVVDIYQNTRRYIPEENNLSYHYHEGLKYQNEFS